ncbi:hypothetical protein B0J14DRAFT_613406 [Halenospora varia]|nr:hypothetical protein B0J14DRAFT_613406 [Halenospora varia]
MSFFTSMVWVIFGALSPIALATPTRQAASECNATALMAAADAYVAVQTAGKMESMQTLLSPSFTYMENNKETPVAKGVLSKALKIDHRRTNTDLVLCATYNEIIVSDAANPYVIGTQIRHNNFAKGDMSVTMIDSIASTTNSWLFDAKKTLGHVLEEKWDVIPVEKRDKREVIQAAGDAYMDMWNNATASNYVPWGTPCTRLEGSAYTGKGKPDDSCKPGIPSNHSQAGNTHRRYVIDEAMGSVSIFCVWEHMMMAADSHEFRLEGGS